MSLRVALIAIAASLTAPALAQTSVERSGVPALASTLQGQKPWDFLDPSPSATAREVPATGSIAPRAQRTGNRVAR